MSQDLGAAERERTVEREWNDFAGRNEYETALSASDVDTVSASVIGREWQDFAGTNEYRFEGDDGAAADTDGEATDRPLST